MQEVGLVAGQCPLCAKSDVEYLFVASGERKD